MIRRHFTWAASTTLPTKYGECITSEVFVSLKCDCKDQLDNALALISRRRAAPRRGAGAVLYLRQEDRQH